MLSNKRTYLLPVRYYAPIVSPFTWFKYMFKMPNEELPTLFIFT